MELAPRNSVHSLFLLVPDLAPCGIAAPARILAATLPRDQFHVTIGILGPAGGTECEEIRAAGGALHALPIRHVFDLNGVRRLRRVVREADATVVHAWGPSAVRASRLVVSGHGEGDNTPRLVVSGAATPGGGLGGWLTARQVRRADRVIPVTRTEGERYRQLGVRSDHLTLIGPAAPLAAAEPDYEAFHRTLDIPPSSRLIIAGGRSESGVGPRDAIVAFDMLRYDAPDLHLVVFGSGHEALALERFGRALAFDDFRVRFATCSPHRATAVSMAGVVFITRPRGGVEEALEAMAAGKPVVAWRTPELAEIVDDGVTGFLVPVGDRAALATRARTLLDDPATVTRMGEAGRARAIERFAATRMTEQYARVYRELAG